MPILIFLSQHIKRAIDVNLSGEARRQLASSGWFEDRNVDTADFEKLCRENGYPILDEVLRFVRKFSGIAGEHKAFRVSAMDRFDFNSCQAIRNIPKERVDVYSIRFGQLMVPVGEACNSHLILMVSSGGNLLGAYDDFLCELGDSIEEGLTVLFESNENKIIS